MAGALVTLDHASVWELAKVPLAAAVAFVIGAVNPATILARILGKDLRTSGSGNPGATNAGRVLGPRWGVVVGILDVLKGLLPVLLAQHFLGTITALVVGLAVVVGHIWSPFLKGQGGKGVATSLGAILAVAAVVRARDGAGVRAPRVAVALGGWGVGVGLPGPARRSGSCRGCGGCRSGPGTPGRGASCWPCS